MSTPHLRRKYELMSFALNAAVPLAFVVVSAIQHIQLQQYSQKIENLEAKIATLELNLLNPASNAPYSTNHPTPVPTTPK